MNPFSKKSPTLLGLISAAGALLALLPARAVQAAVPGISSTSFSLVASADRVSQPDGASIYAWGYGCDATASAPGFTPFTGTCPQMQMPGPTMVIPEGQAISVTLTNNLPPAAGKTSIVFPGFQVSSLVGGVQTGVPGLITQEAANASCNPIVNAGCNTVTYTFTATAPGTYSYYSGTQPDLQIEMGLFGAIIVTPVQPLAACRGIGPGDFRLAPSAYDHSATCYDREYLFQLSEMDSRIHDQAQAQVQACPVGPCGAIKVTTSPYRPNYFLINGRSMPDNMDASYSGAYPHQPYNANPHMHPGELVLMRIIGQGRIQHPFHFHGNHARVLARDANLMLSAKDGISLAGPLLFTTPSVPGQTQDQIFTWSGKGLNWDVYNHRAGDGSVCTPDANGFNSVVGSLNFGEWCADHNKPIPVTPPDPTISALGQWYAGTPYLSLQNSNGFTNNNEAPGTLNQNPPAESGYAYMWHSHNEREITTNDVFPGGMLSMLLIDPQAWLIDEKQ